MTAPSILLVDDGELDRVQQLLERLHVDWVRCVKPGSQVVLERPLDLLITSGPRAMSMPVLLGAGEPLWVCIYDQDFLPLRERLRELGVHYLVAGDLAPRTFELFLRQLLHRGEERRQVRRIPLHCPFELAIGFERRNGLLLELSRESCVFATDAAVPEGRPVVVRLLPEITGDVPLELPGTVHRSTGAPGKPGEYGVTTLFRFDPLDAEAMACIHHLLSGYALATQVTPLRAEPGAAPAATGWTVNDPPPERWQPEQSDRRRAHRHHYGQRVDAIRWNGEPGVHTAFGHDLSRTGVCIVASQQPAVGDEVSLALYGRAREEPLLVGARVVRVENEEVGLHFVDLSPTQCRDLERLLAASPCVEDLEADPRRVHVAELVAG